MIGNKLRYIYLISMALFLMGIHLNWGWFWWWVQVISAIADASYSFWLIEGRWCESE